MDPAGVSGAVAGPCAGRDADQANSAERRGEHVSVLWSRATARDIVEVIAADAEAGTLAPTEAVELIDRVWDRAARP